MSKTEKGEPDGNGSLPHTDMEDIPSIDGEESVEDIETKPQALTPLQNADDGLSEKAAEDRIQGVGLEEPSNGTGSLEGETSNMLNINSGTEESDQNSDQNILNAGSLAQANLLVKDEQSITHEDVKASELERPSPDVQSSIANGNVNIPVEMEIDAPNVEIPKEPQIDSLNEVSGNYEVSNSVADTADEDTAVVDADDREEGEGSIADDSGAYEAPGNLEAAATHSFSFHIKKEEISHGETESESHTELPPAPGTEMQPPACKPSKLKNRAKKLKDSKAAKDGKDSDSSVSSKKKGSKKKTQIKCKFAPGGLEYIENCLRGRIFSGWVEERRWVDNLGSYRDVIEVDESELEMNMKLNTIVRSIPGVQDGTKWINITPPTATESCYCMWVLLPEPPSPGHYWFCITGVATQPQFGVRISLRIIRSIYPQDFETSDARQKRKKQLINFEPSQELESVGQQLQEWWDQVKQLNWAIVWSAIATTLTFNNIRESIRFIVVLCITLAVGFVSVLRESHHELLRFIHEAGVFLRNITPFLQSIMGFVEKLIGGLYLLIAMVYRDFRRPSAPPPPQHFPGIRPAPLPVMGGPTPQSHPGPRVVTYVPPEQWVYKSGNS